MGASSVKYPKKRAAAKAAVRKEEPVLSTIDKATFLAHVERIAPVHVNGYVCLF